nr:anti-bacterial ssDNA antibody heavy chain CDR2 region [mice, BALB/c, hybridoma SECF5/10, Peptide Partial, 17 aa] [Mus sp.]
SIDSSDSYTRYDQKFKG